MNKRYLIPILLVPVIYSSICVGQIKTNTVPNFVNPFKNKTNQAVISTISPAGTNKGTSLPQQEISIKPVKGSFYFDLKKVKVESKSLSLNLNSWFSLNENHSFKKINERTDDLGYTHINYQQQYNSIPIDGCIIMLHTNDGMNTS